jgi:LmbE family N-acetylglucosaminyl deacetylase
MIVAHPDDETIFGGRLLAERAPDGRAPAACWTVVSVTNGGTAARRAEFQRAVRAAGARFEMWDYADCPACVPLKVLCAMYARARMCVCARVCVSMCVQQCVQCVQCARARGREGRHTH